MRRNHKLIELAVPMPQRYSRGRPASQLINYASMSILPVPRNAVLVNDRKNAIFQTSALMFNNSLFCTVIYKLNLFGWMIVYRISLNLTKLV